MHESESKILKKLLKKNGKKNHKGLKVGDDELDNDLLHDTVVVESAWILGERTS